jgi:four helix bundle protein
VFRQVFEEALMNYKDWLITVPKEITDDTLWRMEVYRISLFAGDLAWRVASKPMQDNRTRELSNQLYSAVGSIGANISEGYSRSSHKDQARFYEYSLGSARESRNWYFEGRFISSDAVSSHRIQLHTHIVRHLLNIIPAERGYRLSEEPVSYEAGDTEDCDQLLESVPMPDGCESPQYATRNT